MPELADRIYERARLTGEFRRRSGATSSALVRKASKTYGTCWLAEGGEVAGRRIAVIEDVLTSGGQVIEPRRELRDRGADIAGVLCVIDREAGGREDLAAEGLDLRAPFAMSQLRAGRATERAHS